jgi:chromosome segregation protein
MFIKRIEIHGFKSFAEKTILEFKNNKNSKNNIVSIIGPNGSGKSNISDAIRWVLGEQSMKHLRGKKSEDIIFAGSESKSKMSVASVSMVLDNSDKKVDIDYDEITITRRLYRTGESEYLLNKRKIKLFELQLLLAKAQFGKDSYSLIGQGTIDRLLLQSTAERKDFFDEAVGI